MIELDRTLIALIITVLALVFILNVVMFRPIRNSLRMRHERMASGEDEVSQLSEQSQGITGEIQENLAAARRQGQSEREALRLAGAQSETSLLEQVKKEVEMEWGRVEQKIKDDMGRARETLKAQAQSFAQSIASKIMGRELS